LEGVVRVARVDRSMIGESQKYGYAQPAKTVAGYSLKGFQKDKQYRAHHNHRMRSAPGEVPWGGMAVFLSGLLADFDQNHQQAPARSQLTSLKAGYPDRAAG